MEKKESFSTLQNSELIKAYKIRLGFNPKGQKQKEGDGKTPEGKYYITSQKPKQ